MTTAPDFTNMTKDQLEAYGRTIGIELDRRLTQEDLIAQLNTHIEASASTSDGVATSTSTGNENTGTSASADASYQAFLI